MNELLSQSKIAFRCGITRETARNRLKTAGIEPVEDKGNEKLYEFTPELKEILTGGADLEALKKRKLKADAEKSELVVQEKKGELVPVSEVKEAIQSIFSNLQNEIVIQSPKKLAAKLKKATTAGQIQALLREELDRPFQKLREDFRQYL